MKVMWCIGRASPRACGTGTMLALLGLAVLAPTALATTNYHLRVLAAPTFSQRFVFALTCSDSLNALRILNAEHDGSGQVTSTEGGPPMGKLLSGYNPADTTVIVGGTFYSDIDLLLEGFTQFDCGLELTEQAPQGGSATSQFGLYWLNESEDVRLADDPLGANALAAIDVTSAPGGELSVFYPLTFVAPDTLLLDGVLAGVPPTATGEHVRVSMIAPNPALGTVRFAFQLPSRGHVELRIFDVAGRLVAEPLRAVLDAGPADVSWNARGRSGQIMPAGFYIAELRQGRQSAVRRFVLAR